MRIIMVSPFAIAPKATCKERILPIAISLKKSGNDVQIIIPPFDNINDTNSELFIEDVKLTNIKISSIRLLNIFRILRLIFSSYPQVIYVFKSSYYSIFVLTILLILKKGRKRFPKLFLDREDWEADWIILKQKSNFISKMQRYFEKYIIRNVDGITVVSRFLYRDTQNLLYTSSKKYRNKIKYIPNGILSEPKIASGNFPLKENNKLHICIYTRFWEIDIDIVYAIIKNIIKKCLEFAIEFRIIGRGSHNQDKELRSKFAKDNLEDYVVFLGWMDFGKIQQELLKCDIALFYINDTNISKAKCSVRLIQHMAFKNAIVASNIGEVSRYIIDNNTGLLVNKNDPQEFVEKTLKLLRNPSLRRDLGDAAYHYLWDHYDMNILAKRIQRFFNSTMLNINSSELR